MEEVVQVLERNNPNPQALARSAPCLCSGRTYHYCMLIAVCVQPASERQVGAPLHHQCHCCGQLKARVLAASRAHLSVDRHAPVPCSAACPVTAPEFPP